MEENSTESTSSLAREELARHLVILRKGLYRCVWDGQPWLVALAILGLWYQDRTGELFEEPSELEEEMTRKPKGGQENRSATTRRSNFC
jgi:hypothetical protein